MTSRLRSAARLRGIVAVALLLSGLASEVVAVTSAVEGLEKISLPNLVKMADEKGIDQSVLQESWREITENATSEELPIILAAMKDAGPLAQNWLRAAADTIAEREFAKTGKLPHELLEKFVLDLEQAPRARRVAYEWLTKVDDDASWRLLPEMLDDPSLELRYDAVASLLNSAGASGDEENKIKMYRRALQSARDLEQLRTCATALADLGQKLSMTEEMGFLTTWKVIGPFDNTDRAGFDKVYPLESSYAEGKQLATEFQGLEGPLAWKSATGEQESLDALGVVDLNAALVEKKSVLAYAMTTFFVSKQRDAELRYETRQATKVWLNGEELAAKNVYHSGGGFDQYIVPCQLKNGTNTILIKVCQNEQTQPWTRPWDFRLRVTDKLGGAIKTAQ